MSLPRFLKGLQRKPSSAQPSIPSHPSDHNLSDASTASSASGPKDAFGFPLPVTTVITTIKPIPASMLTSTGSSPCSSPYPGPMDIVILPVSTESSSNSNRKGSGSIGGYSRNSSHSGRFASTHTTNRSSQSSSQSSMRLSQDKDDSVLLNSSLSTSCPQLTLPPLSVPPVPSPALNSINSIPVPTANKATLSSPSSNAGTTIVGFDIITTTLTEDQDESDGDIAANQTQDTTGAVGGARNRQSKGLHHHDNLYHITPVKGNRSRSNAVAMLPGTGTTIISAANYSYPNPPAAGPTAGSIPSLGSAADPEPIRTLRQDSICPSSRMQERTAGSGSVCNIASSTSTATELIHSGTSNDPQQSSASLSSISSTRSRSLTSPHDAAATDRPASILIKPKSILRSRSCSGSQRRLQSELSQPQPQPQDSITSVLPSPPTTVRISASSDRSLVYQPSLYLHQDPMAEGGGEGHVIAMDTGTRSRTGGIHSQRRPSTSSRGSGNVQSGKP
ncbi:hypothetical protein BC939DRAFT_466361 [Gamsiella multidivaricata]|uniref:uncharacterized protein n=1 Tax=Gamsiella multidivaricata TaxID=101098 RepID=UPI00221F85E0|nr:uncharacterized protein BC939DRAFT_466361 [Gamsiella multidivaricata]KAI7817330.1 hypothetical protein BC939DRAFT_466361 [Gamsiella multidivaricata]